MSVPDIYIDSMLWFKTADFDKEWVDEQKTRLSVFVRNGNPNAKKKGNWVANYCHVRSTGLMGIPIAYGIDLFRSIPHRKHWETVAGKPVTFPKRPDPLHKSASEGQAELMQDALDAAHRRVALLVEAPTGAGKTVVALNTIAELGKTTLVIVRTKVLAQQWIRQAVAVLGADPKRIGTVQGGKAYYDGKDIVVAVIHNLTDREWPDEFYDYFGTVVWDEAHCLGAEFFARSMALFPARHRIALTATPSRKDGAASIFIDYFGKSSVVGQSDAVEAECTVVELITPISDWIDDMNRAQLLNEITQNDERNQHIVEAVMEKYRRGRQVLVISDRISQLQSLMRRCIVAGMRSSHAGLFTRTYRTRAGKTKTATEKKLDKVRLNAQVIFATYGMAKEGLDIPRLDAGVEASPQSCAVQAIGRIRRPLPNKPTPEWVTFNDSNIPIFDRMTMSRVRGLRRVNVNIKHVTK